MSESEPLGGPGGMLLRCAQVIARYHVVISGRGDVDLEVWNLACQ